MNVKYRTVAALQADGFSAAECARKMKISQRSIEGIRRLPEVQALRTKFEENGIPPRERLSLLTYSLSETVALRAASELLKFPDIEPDANEHDVEKVVVYAPKAT